MKKARNILLWIGIGLLILQVPWFFAIQASINKTSAKTTATVIRIESADAGCSGDRSGSYDTTCDHSQQQFPVYEYYDAAGKRHEQDDRFFGAYKHNNPLRLLFWKNVGDTVTAYYTPDRPQEVLFMAGPLAYTAWTVPLYGATPALLAASILWMIQKFKNKRV